MSPIQYLKRQSAIYLRAIREAEQNAAVREYRLKEPPTTDNARVVADRRHAFALGFKCGWERCEKLSEPQLTDRPVTRHPACRPDMAVNGGALMLALTVLRRAGKNEVANELEATAIPLQDVATAPPPPENVHWCAACTPDNCSGCKIPSASQHKTPACL